MKRITFGYLCIVLLGIANWPMLAIAQGGANSNPTCDEITSAYVCTVPEVLVTAPRTWWLYGTQLQHYLNQLTDRELLRFTEMAIATIRAQLPEDLNSSLSDSKIERRQENAEAVLMHREFIKELTKFADSDSCDRIAIVAAAFGATLVRLQAAGPIGVTGYLVTLGGLAVAYACTFGNQ